MAIERKTRPPATIADDMLKGIDEISEFLGLPVRRTYRLANLGKLPGVFQLGRLWYGRRSALVKKIERLEGERPPIDFGAEARRATNEREAV